MITSFYDIFDIDVFTTRVLKYRDDDIQLLG